MNNLARSLVVGCSLLALAGCGADDVVAPGGPIIVNPTPTPTSTPTPTAPGSVTAAAACTTGTTDGGTIALQNGRGTVRNCILPTQVTGTLQLTGRRADGIMYSLPGRVDVGTDISLGGTAATLEVFPGVTVFGSTLESSLIVNRGSKLEADGSASQPIIFTSRSNLTGSGLSDTSVNQWGGIIINGRAPVSECDNTVSPGGTTTGGDANCWRKAEGVAVDTLFGGNLANDDSGTLRYVQINFTGVGANGNEIQGLTTGGVGSGTTFSHVQIHNSSDDGIEIFGGTANMKNLVITGAADDSLDTDVGYRGAIQFVLAVRRNDNYPGDSAGSRTMMEVDSGGNGDSQPRQYLKLANFTFIQPTPGEPAIRIRGGADADLVNGLVIANATGNTVGCFDIDEAATTQASGTDERGPVRLLSVAFQCNGGMTNDADGFDAATLANAANANVVQNLVNTLIELTGSTVGKIAPGGTELALTAASNITAISSFFTQVNYVGAFSGPGDTWTTSWTCNSDIADLRGASACTDIRIF